MTLEEAKSYLRIEYEEDDVLIYDLMLASEAYIDECAGTAYKNHEKAITLSNLLQKKLIADMFENRGTEISNSTKKDNIVTTILEKLSNYTEDE